ncbi:MAG: hypothetical protein M1818_003396 [Claussenomyces sp. TS43310]|nr:MAG: hypothetical protein M1818_003396 [Claussenomyces sp. TS43310]
MATSEAEPTPYAKRYGVAVEDWLKSVGKSGLTPLTPLDPSLPIARPELRRARRHYQYQNLDGYESALLDKAKAIDDDSIRPSDLTVIHPLFARERWTRNPWAHQCLIPLGHGRSGDWTASNDEVWDVLQPCLALTSMFMSQSWPWWDALVNGQPQIIPTPPCPEELRGSLRRLTRRPPEISQTSEARGAVQAAFDRLATVVTFSISEGCSKADDGMPDLKWDGVTFPFFSESPDAMRRVPKIFISSQQLVPLLFDGLPQSDKLKLQFNIGLTLLHECAHAMFNLIHGTPESTAEVYFEDEGIAELGFSMINGIFGGIFRQYPRSRSQIWELSQKAFLTFEYQLDWPHAMAHSLESQGAQPSLMIAKPAYDSFITPLRWISDLQKQSFWSHYIGSYGLTAVRPSPLSLGLRQYWNDGQYTRVDVRLVDAEDYDEAERGLAAVHKGARKLKKHRLRQARDIAWALHFKVQAIVTEEAKSRQGDGVPEQLPFIQWYERNATLDPATSEPARFQEIRRLITSSAMIDDLKLETLRWWTPALLLLSYINRVNPGPKLLLEHFFDFLTYCEVSQQLFHFLRKGGGVVRRRDKGWLQREVIAQPAIEPVADQAAIMSQLKGSQMLTFPTIRSDDELRDVDVEFVWQNFQLLQRLDREYGVPPTAAIDRPTFDQAMEYCSSRGIFLVSIPKLRIYRRLDRGWWIGEFKGL